ncbi:hypothetical protein J6590_034043 [Homalodisca vitripennis]|nr:hypothetical protein J6590_034043 [Homalodisca vitripennis]
MNTNTASVRAPSPSDPEALAGEDLTATFRHELAADAAADEFIAQRHCLSAPTWTLKILRYHICLVDAFGCPSFCPLTFTSSLHGYKLLGVPMAERSKMFDFWSELETAQDRIMYVTIDLVLYRLSPLSCLIRSSHRLVAHEDGQKKV